MASTVGTGAEVAGATVEAGAWVAGTGVAAGAQAESARTKTVMIPTNIVILLDILHLLFFDRIRQSMNI
jgi:hypothetical protein